MNEDYNNLVSSIADRLLEEGPEEGPNNEGESSTPDTKDSKQTFAKGAVVGGLANTVMDIANKVVNYRHFGSHVSLGGETSGTGED